MKRLMLVVGMLLAACSGTPPPPDAGTDAGEETPVEIKVSGTAVMFPDAVPLLNDAGISTDVAGLTLRIEEPFKVAIDDPQGIFHTQTLATGGAYSAPKVPTDLITLGLAAGIRDDSGNRVLRSATTIYDVALANGAKPSGDVTNTKAYVLPVSFHDALTQAVGQARIRSLTGMTDAGTLIEAGFVVGKVVDTSGNPVAGVTIEPVGSTAAARTARLFYPTADLSSVGSATSASGLFVYVHNGALDATGKPEVATFQFKVTGRAEYKQRNAGARKDAALVLWVSPAGQ